MPVASMVEQMPISEVFDWLQYYKDVEEDRNKEPEPKQLAEMSPDEVGAMFNVRGK